MLPIHLWRVYKGCFIPPPYFSNMILSSLITIYLLGYFTLIWALCVAIFYYSHIFAFSKSSLSVFMSFMLSYTNKLPIIYLIILLLSGLPPFLLFIVKFNFLIVTYFYYGIIAWVLMLVFLFAGVVFYLQFFKLRNSQDQLKAIDPMLLKHYKTLEQKKMLYNPRFFFSPKELYKITYFLIWCAVFNFATFFFFTDLYLITLNLTYVL